MVLYPKIELRLGFQERMRIRNDTSYVNLQLLEFTFIGKGGILNVTTFTRANAKADDCKEVCIRAEHFVVHKPVRM
jgi:hypothetical protein